MTGTTSDAHAQISGASFPPTTIRAIAYAGISIVSATMIARITLQILRPRKVTPQDYCMVFAYLLFLAQCILYIAITPIQARVQDYADGKIPPYPGLPKDVSFLGKMMFPALLFFWTILWIVKFGLLLWYRRLIAGLPRGYNRIWWSMVVICGVTLLGNYIAFLASCDSLGSFFKESRECYNRVRQFISIWYSYGADTTTNLMLIAFPWHLTWNLQMQRRQKIAITALFGSGVFCILIATLRAANVTANAIRSEKEMDGTWLEVWSMIETTVALVIGLTPSFATLIHTNRHGVRSSGRLEYEERETQLETIGGSGSLGNRRKQRLTGTWIAINDSEEQLSKPDNVSAATSWGQGEGNLGRAI